MANLWFGCICRHTLERVYWCKTMIAIGHGCGKDISRNQKKVFLVLIKEINEFVGKCIPCQTRNFRKQQPHMQEWDFPPLSFANLALDISGFFSKTHSGNQYKVTFIYMYNDWPEAFAVPNKMTDLMAHLLIDEIFTKFWTPLQLLTDNGPENINKITKKTLEDLNVYHVTMSLYVLRVMVRLRGSTEGSMMFWRIKLE